MKKIKDGLSDLARLLPAAPNQSTPEEESEDDGMRVVTSTGEHVELGQDKQRTADLNDSSK